MATLSAEGKVSANVLIALPIAIAAVLCVVSPSYIGVLPLRRKLGSPPLIHTVPGAGYRFDA